MTVDGVHALPLPFLQGVLLTPAQAAPLESLLPPPLALRLRCWLRPRSLIRCHFGVSLTELLQPGPGSPDTLVAMLEASKGRHYLIRLDRGVWSRTVKVVLHADARPEDKLAAFVHMRHLAHLAQQGGAGVGAGAAADRGVEEECQRRVDRDAGRLAGLMAAAGWQCQRDALPSFPWSARWKVAEVKQD